jgi:hypothetical protein
MKEQWNQWLLDQARVSGLHACGLRHADQSVFTLSCSPAFPPEHLDNAWRCVADTFQVLKHHRIPAVHLRWVFEHALFYCLNRSDGMGLMVFTSRKAQELDSDGLQKIFAQFLERADVHP